MSASSSHINHASLHGSNWIGKSTTEDDVKEFLQVKLPGLFLLIGILGVSLGAAYALQATTNTDLIFSSSVIILGGTSILGAFIVGRKTF